MAASCRPISNPDFRPGVGGQILGAFIPLLANSVSTIDIGALVGQAAGGGVAGAILTAVVGLIKNKMA
jgi:hypothetical protein